MMSTRLIPWAGLAAMVAQALLIVVTPVAGAAYWATQAPTGVPPRPSCPRCAPCWSRC